MPKTIGPADLATAVSAAVASMQKRPEPVVVGLSPAARAWPQAAPSFLSARPSAPPKWRDGAPPPRASAPKAAAKANSSFEGWRGNA
ncbi:hypothetical protein M2323_000752 [Rhodoblastus acidophilus]|uniref:hypothetical protein n=1 Tax=Rhodoblastus acidophilus TaxID=1074 RepID=UPI0022250DC5|nr:hypothetical protein [Rhodoblastus acidophilus]MCW2283101.1 hypothetical protein [Rhodoblastus acidophilus]MCW2331848.1 hypothetical protein [Rhodoblastus acidophilus]